MSFNPTRDIDEIPFIKKEYDNNLAARKLWDIHQKDEYQRINKHREGLCYGCFKKDVVGARMVDICKTCRAKRSPETVLTMLSSKMYGYCMFCGRYTWDIAHINVRMCRPCNGKIARLANSMNATGGKLAHDPFWLKARRKFGKDYKELFMFPNMTKGV